MRHCGPKLSREFWPPRGTSLCVRGLRHGQPLVDRVKLPPQPLASDAVGVGVGLLVRAVGVVVGLGVPPHRLRLSDVVRRVYIAKKLSIVELPLVPVVLLLRRGTPQVGLLVLVGLV